MYNRNYGIDFLRIVSMYLIIILHILGQGGILKNVSIFSSSYQIAWFLEIAAYCTVNCYALISGYVGLNSKYRISNIIYLWCKVLFYSVLISLIFMIFKNDIDIKALLISFFPVCSKKYWYVTAYFCLYVFIPVLNEAVNKLNNKQLYFVIFAMLINFSVLPTLFRIDIFYLQNGYSGLWLIVLYFVGASLRKLNLLECISYKKSLIIYFVSIFMTLFSKNIIQYICLNFFGSEYDGMMFVSYLSPTIICEAIMLLSIFSKLEISEKMKKWIKYISPLSFGVYLIHVHPLIFTEMKEMFSPFANMNIIMMMISICLCSFIIFIVCIFIDLIREQLFKKFRIKDRLAFLDQFI